MGAGRSWLLHVHRWVGLAMVLVLAIEGLTGSLIAIRAPLTRWLAPELHATPPAPGAKPLPLAELAERAQRDLGSTVRIAYFFDGSANGQTMVRVAPTIDPPTGRRHRIVFGWVAFDPWSGRELGRFSDAGYTAGLLPNIMPFLYQVHVCLSLGSTGNWILGITALAWTLDCLYAPLLTVPRGRHRLLARWLPAWRLKRNASSTRTYFDLHRAGGLWFLPLLFVFAWSSVQLTRLDVYEAVTARLFSYRSIDAEFADLPHHDANPPRLDWREAQAAGDAIVAQQARREGFHALHPAMLAYFEENGIYSYSVQTDRSLPNARSYDVYIDGDSGRLFRILRMQGEHTGNTVTNWLRALHFASDPLDRAWYRWTIFITGLCTTLLCVTGVVIWWRKRSSRTRTHYA